MINNIIIPLLWCDSLLLMGIILIINIIVELLTMHIVISQYL